MTMEAIKLVSLPTSNSSSICSLLNSNTADSSDLSSGKEDELLCGDDDDDDLRLRLSDGDDDIDQGDDIPTGLVDCQPKKIQHENDEFKTASHVEIKSPEKIELDKIIDKAKDFKDTSNIDEKEYFSEPEDIIINDTSDIVDEIRMNGSEKMPALSRNNRYWSNNYDNRWSGENSRGRGNFRSRGFHQPYGNHNYNNFNRFKNKSHNYQFNLYSSQSKSRSDERKTEVRNKEPYKKENDKEVAKTKKSEKKDLETQDQNSNDPAINGHLENNADIKIKSEVEAVNDQKDINVDLNPFHSEKCKESDVIINQEITDEKELEEYSKEIVDININLDLDSVSTTKDSCDDSVIRENTDETCMEQGNLEISLQNNKDSNDSLNQEQDVSVSADSVSTESNIENVCNNSEINLDTQRHIDGIENVDLKDTANSLKVKADNSDILLSKETAVLDNKLEELVHNEQLEVEENDNLNKQNNTLNDDSLSSIREKFQNNAPSEQNESSSQKDDINKGSELENIKNNEKTDIKESENVNHSKVSEDSSVDVLNCDSTNLFSSGKSEEENDKLKHCTSEPAIENSSNSIKEKISEENCNLNDMEVSIESDNDESKCNINENSNNIDTNKNENCEMEDDVEKEISDTTNKFPSFDVDEECARDGINPENVVEEVDLNDEEVMGISFSNDEDSLSKPESRNSFEDSSNAVAVQNNETRQSDYQAIPQKRKYKKKETSANIDILDDAESGGRQRRRSAKNSEEITRKVIMKDAESDNSSDDDNNVIPYKKPSYNTQSTNLKRTLEDIESVAKGDLKKLKSDLGNISSETTIVACSKKSNDSVNQKAAEIARRLSTEDIRAKLNKLTQEELEAMLLQKIAENITQKGEIGKLREQARVAKRNLEATKSKCQQLNKQVEGFDMVIKRISHDKNTNNDKYLPPIKINRSVGLQVNFISQENGIQNLRQIQGKSTINTNTSNNLTNNAAASPIKHNDLSKESSNRQNLQSTKKVLKTKPPRRIEPLIVPPVQSKSPAQVQPVPTSTATPTTLILNTHNSRQIANDIKRTIPIHISSTSATIQTVTSPQGTQSAILVNTSTVNANSRPALTLQKIVPSTSSKSNDLIDLTDEEEKSKSVVNLQPITTALVTDPNNKGRLSRVLQAQIANLPQNVTITAPTNIKFVQSNGQTSQQAIVNNLAGAQRLAYVMQNGGRQYVLTGPSPIRPGTTVASRNISTVNYKTGVPLGGTVRLLAPQATTSNVQIYTRHPAPLPEAPPIEKNPAWKQPPPSPSLKITKVPTGIVLSWNMTLTDKYAEIVSYQLYAYQEVTGVSPSSSLWKKVGDVRALPLPMACTLTQFSEGNNYHFAVRAVDAHSRFGQYSKPQNISL